MCLLHFAIHDLELGITELDLRVADTPNTTGAHNNR